jgi:hypothetical protein
VSKETYYSVKRDLLEVERADIGSSHPGLPSGLHSVKRDLLQCQKRPTTVSKETYYSGLHSASAARGSFGIEPTVMK